MLEQSGSQEPLLEVIDNVDRLLKRLSLENEGEKFSFLMYLLAMTKEEASSAMVNYGTSSQH
ncbi:hypothetical protein ACFSE1_03320 [Rhizobium helianthi]|uniref:Uncharacterized protein n=1 Tax=Rhizobium helianthi TaxID=1132695 RepID=A0ABW4LZ88_9HYPH